MTQEVATECGTCGGDIGLWVPPNLKHGYTHMKAGGAADFEANKNHDVVPTWYVSFPPSWTVAP
jgi:hypothetical protein